MAFASQYLNKQKGWVQHIEPIPSNNLKFIVVIPVFCEPDLSGALESLWKCNRIHSDIEIILVVNASEDSSAQIQQINRQTIKATETWIGSHADPSLVFYLLHNNRLPLKDAGAGLARKIGMDEALCRFNLINNPNGYIVSFDADCRCDSNYFTAMEQSLQKKNIKGFDLYFEHPVTGSEYSPETYLGIVDYELHLRYVNQFLRFAGFPFAHHTVGSCFGVRADVYAAQGGMNKRKAGEDFYFLHKIIPLGNFTDITTTRIIPSPRESSRVPFGTGVAISKYLSNNRELTTYHPNSFLALKHFFEKVPFLFKAREEEIFLATEALPDPLKLFLHANQVLQSVSEINHNCRTVDSFIIRFYRWFDAFRIVKFLNYAGKNCYPDMPVSEAVAYFLTKCRHEEGLAQITSPGLLNIMRRVERAGR